MGIRLTKPYSFDAWDTVIRELQAKREELFAQRDVTTDYRCERIRRLIAAIQEEWNHEKE